jgi:hypothetical protein
MNDERLETAESAIAATSQRPKVITDFHGYEPPFDVAPIVERMLASVPSKYLVGLSKVVLTNSSGLSRKIRRSVTKSRKRKVRIVKACGLYYQEWNNKPAWIQIFVDNTLKGWENGFWLRIPLLRESQLGGVLFHEIGHHIHYTTRPEHREKEDVADVWKVRLEKNYQRVRHPILRAVLTFLKPVTRTLIRRFHYSAAERMLLRGAISRAEFDETTKGSASTNRRAPPT